MRFFHAILAVTIITFLTTPSPLCGQGYGRTRQTSGLFGERTLGQTLKPRPSQFGGGVQRGPGGAFSGVNRQGANMFNVPWRHNEDISPLIYAPFLPLQPLEPTATAPTEVVVPQETPTQPVVPVPQVPTTPEPNAPEFNAPQPNAPAVPAPEPAGPTEQ